VGSKGIGIAGCLLKMDVHVYFGIHYKPEQIPDKEGLAGFGFNPSK